MRVLALLEIAVEAATDNDKKTVTANGQTTVTYPQDGAVTYKWTAVNSNGVSQGTFANDTVASTTWTAPTTAGTYTVKCALDDPWTGTQTGVTLPETGSKNDKAADGSAPVVRSVTVYVTKVRFVEDADQKYGFDDGTYYNPPVAVPWKSVEVDNTDTAFAEITTGTNPTDVSFRSSKPNVMTIAPGQASTSRQKVTVTAGTSKDVAEATAQIGVVDPSPSKMNVSVYRRRTALLHEYL